MRQPQRGRLADVGHVEPERPAVANRRLDRRSGIADHDPDAGDARVPDRLQAVKQHRLVRDREQLLGRRVRDWPEPGTRASCQNQGFHGRDAIASAGHKTQYFYLFY
jgi:hypothetical protein